MFIMAPAHIYNPLELFGLTSHLENGGKIVIAGDWGTTNWLLVLSDIFLIPNMILKLFGGQGTGPLGCELMPGVLHDDGFNDGTPTNVLIQNIDPALKTGVTTIKVRSAAAIQGNILGGIFGFNTWIPIVQSSSMSWLDSNLNGAQDANEDSKAHIIGVVNADLNIILLSDPDIFTNQNYGDAGIDNREFVQNIVNVFCAATPSISFVAFDEGHQAKLMPPFFGFILMFVYCSAIGVLSFITPYLIYRLIRRFIPKAEMPKVQRESKLFKKKGRTAYYERMRWYRQKRQYNKAIGLLYRRLKRNLMNILELKEFDKDKVIGVIQKFKPEVNINRIRVNLRRLELIEKNKAKITDPYDFMHYFYEMRWISDTLSK